MPAGYKASISTFLSSPPWTFLLGEHGPPQHLTNQAGSYFLPNRTIQRACPFYPPCAAFNVPLDQGLANSLVHVS